MLDRGQRDDDLLALARRIEIGHGAAADETFGQVIGQILDARETELVQRLHQLGADAVKRGHLCEERIESLGAHVAFANTELASLRVEGAQSCG